MTEVSVYDARNRLSALIEQVERGGEVTITRHGKAVARLVKAETADRPTLAAQRLLALRDAIGQRGESFSMDELRGFRDDGRL